ncbi:hypothetical protein TWF694_004496 [Orbilia ellipsospora]|uniref:Protein kinase domain-containing protein n=1 Tax=Orbilia ellipsospora TaxID=2528407 RepID=A0AAV9WWK7_9PEZI
MTDVGSIITLTQIAFKCACVAVDAAYKAANLFEDSEALVVRLELERFRLQTWGSNSGLIDNELSPTLRIVHKILVRELKLIEETFTDASKLCERYFIPTHGHGAVTPSPLTDSAQDGSSMHPPQDEVDIQPFLLRMRTSLYNSGVSMQRSSEGKAGAGVGKAANDTKDQRIEPGIWKRVRWGIRDKERFSKHVTELHEHVNVLHQLLSETAQRRCREDNHRIKIIFVERATDIRALDLIRSAIGPEHDVETHAMAERKSISVGGENPGLRSRYSSTVPAGLTLSDLNLPPDYAQKQRLLVRRKTDQGLVLLEKKAYDPSISPADKRILLQRLQRLVMLLASTESPSFRSLRALGSIADVTNYCWWLALEFPASCGPDTPLAEPITLHHLLQPSTKFRPPLERRLQLAVSICGTMSSLFSSGWLHKGLRSANIVFPYLVSSNSIIDTYIIRDPRVGGFEYSRQETESKSINNAEMFTDVAAALYRHPIYHGEGEQEYTMQLDIYSLGLVLVEIALWMPLSSFLDTTDKKGKRIFPAKVESFHREEALKLKELVLSRLEKELAFRAGTVFCDIAKWCLAQGDCSPVELDDENQVHPALEFYNTVCVPLRAVNLAA